MGPKSSFRTLFFDYFLECVCASIFVGFLEAENMKNSNFALTGARFLQNRRFRKSIEKTSILAPFSEAKTEKNREKIVLKNVCFFNIDFLAIFLDFGSILGGPGPSKN